jgi:riboflavin synthase
MFTGLIETIGTVKSVHRQSDIWGIEISAPLLSAELHNGDSISVAGACQTVVSHNAESFMVEAMDETLKRTTFGNFRNGTKVNLERAMRFDSRIDGHIVAGHVDCTSRVLKIEQHKNTKKYFFSVSSDIITGIVEKGSVAIDGVSLTVIDVSCDAFSVELIPITITETTIALLKAGETVNIETDIVGKYIQKLITAKFSDKEMKDKITWNKLAKYGWS